jgi:capsular polysaccharide biosynthesis protein
MTEQYGLSLTLYQFSSDHEHINHSPWLILKNVTLTSGSRLITKERKGFENKAFIAILQNKPLWKNLKIFKLQEEALLKFRMKHFTKKVLLKPYNYRRKLEDLCFSTLSPFSSSWVHWLFEILPQVISLYQSPYKETVKILIEENAPDQIYETLTAFFPGENIVKVTQNEHITCGNLLMNKNTPQSWSILWGRDTNEKLTETFHHDIDALMRVRKAVYERFNISDLPPQKNVFIRRKAIFRFIHNEQELADYLLTKQFSVIEPSIMSFREQVKCFSDTNVIVAQSGASLANIIFMKPGSTVICMAAESTFLNYDYFLTIAKALDISFHYILGKVDDEKKYSHHLHLSINHPLNASFTIDKNKLEKILNNMI